MFDNIDGKLKVYAKIHIIIGFIFSILLLTFVVSDTIYMSMNTAMLLVVIIPIVSIITAWIIYGLGLLIEKTNSIHKMLEWQIDHQIEVESEKAESITE